LPSLLRIQAVLVVLGGILIALRLLVTPAGVTFAEWETAAAVLFVAVLVAVVVGALGELMQLFLQIEENTREA